MKSSREIDRINVSSAMLLGIHKIQEALLRAFDLSEGNYALPFLSAHMHRKEYTENDIQVIRSLLITELSQQIGG